jgi:hypothetical protein
MATDLLGWVDVALSCNGGPIDLHGPYADEAAIARAVIAHYQLAADQEIDVCIGQLRPIRLWDCALPTTEEILALLVRWIHEESVSPGPAAYSPLRIQMVAGETVAAATRDLHWRLQKWGERWLQVLGWWLVRSRPYTVAGDGSVQPLPRNSDGAVR